jgi:hypothetical protein
MGVRIFPARTFLNHAYICDSRKIHGKNAVAYCNFRLSVRKSILRI